MQGVRQKNGNKFIFTLWIDTTWWSTAVGINHASDRPDDIIVGIVQFSIRGSKADRAYRHTADAGDFRRNDGILIMDNLHTFGTFHAISWAAGIVGVPDPIKIICPSGFVFATLQAAWHCY